MFGYEIIALQKYGKSHINIYVVLHHQIPRSTNQHTIVMAEPKEKNRAQ